MNLISSRAVSRPSDGFVITGFVEHQKRWYWRATCQLRETVLVFSSRDASALREMREPARSRALREFQWQSLDTATGSP